MVLSPTSQWSREVLSSGSTRRRFPTHVTTGRMCILCWVGGWRLTALVSFSFRRSRAGVVSGDALPRSHSFNRNGFASHNLLWRYVQLQISDGATSSSGEEVICLIFLDGEGHALIFCIGLSHLFSPILSVFMWPVTKSLFY